MELPSQDFLTWLFNQGVAVVVLAFLLVRLETRLSHLEALIQELADRWYRQNGSWTTPPGATPKGPN